MASTHEALLPSPGTAPSSSPSNQPPFESSALPLPPEYENSLRRGQVAVEVPGKPRKLSSYKKTLGNMVVSIVGCGVLGLPYAFKRSGWVFSIFSLAFMALISYYGMLLLVKTRKILEAKVLGVLDDEPGVSSAETNGKAPAAEPQFKEDSGTVANVAPVLTSIPEVEPDISVRESTSDDPEARESLLDRKHQADGKQEGYFLQITSYGELGYKVMGTSGQVAVDAMICLSQGGFCVAYLIFIGENVSSVLVGSKAYKVWIIICVALGQVFLSWVRSLSRLAPFSIFADVVNLCAFSVVIAYGLMNLKNFTSLQAFTGFENAPAALSVAVYSFEGVGNTLSLEGSMKEPLIFPGVLSLGVAIIATMYGSVGLMGYAAFGDDTDQIVTLNLPTGWATTTVKLGLSLALCFTFPVMMYPVYEVYETRLCQLEFVRNYILPRTLFRRAMFRSLRALVIALVAYVAIGVPHFSTFISLVGSSVCSLLGFVLPALFHLRVGSAIMPTWERIVDYFLIVFGLIFAVWGTWDSVRHMLEKDFGLRI